MSKTGDCIILQTKLTKTSNQTHQNMSKCTGKSKFQEFQNFAKKILTPGMKKELVHAGCFIPNCKQRTWGKPLR